LFVIAWPIAVVLVFLLPLLWLLSIPFRIFGVLLGQCSRLSRRCCTLPARLLGHRG
jgi:hypothetical protein